MTTTSEQIRFDDGAAYERFMGLWSRSAGEQFLRWLTPAPGLRWLDVGCGNGAFTELIVSRCAPSSVDGVDPSDGQLGFARTRPNLASATFVKGDAMALPYPDGRFEAAVMPLVLFFVPEPARGVAEMARVVSVRGLVTAYTWDMPGGGFPYASLFSELKTIGVTPLLPPSAEASRTDVMVKLWTEAGLKDIETREITVERTFADFEDYWETVQGGPGFRQKLASMPRDVVEAFKSRMRAVLPTDSAGRIAYEARANAVKGRVG